MNKYIKFILYNNNQTILRRIDRFVSTWRYLSLSLSLIHQVTLPHLRLESTIKQNQTRTNWTLMQNFGLWQHDRAWFYYLNKEKPGYQKNFWAMISETSLHGRWISNAMACAVWFSVWVCASWSSTAGGASTGCDWFLGMPQLWFTQPKHRRS